jgi:hypothetical protein
LPIQHGNSACNDFRINSKVTIEVVVEEVVEEVTGLAIELRSTLLRPINVYAPKPIMQIAAMG